MTPPTRTSDQVVRPSQTVAPPKLTITVLSGGPGAEREISLQSGAQVGDALASLGHTVYREDISPENLAALARQVDAVFVALHGTFGEDGQVQSILERRKLRYCGSGPEACALAIDKPRAKARFVERGIPTPRWDVATPDSFRAALACWTLPLVVKPPKEGSSIHCHVVRDFADLRPKTESVIERYGACLIEEYVPGIELTVGILGDRALPPIEIRTARDFYDYAAKYERDDTQYLFDIDLPAELLQHVQDLSLAAHRALGCRDFSRADWRVDPAGMRPYLLEVNTIPGFTTHSLLPKAASRVGLSMPQLCDEIVRMALRRRPA
jgi:D-alanine-D-alanine ligase